MIIFRTLTNHKIDLSRFGVSLNEESSLFSDNIYKSYSVPFSIPAEEEIIEMLGLPDLDNITDVDTSVRGKIILPYTYYDAILFLGEIQGGQIECEISYGDAELAVYDRDLKDLPWPVQLVPEFGYGIEVNTKIVSTWPRYAYNYPRVYDASIKEKSNYEAFRGFINDHNGITPVFNNVDNSGEEPIYYNYNVLAPFPYLLEILRFGYLQEGKTISGELFDDEIMKQALYIPQNFLEKFKGSEYLAFSFSTPTSTENENRGVYKRTFIPEKIGTYQVDYKLNIDPITASYFDFKVYQDDPNSFNRTILLENTSTNNRVRLSDKLKVNVTSENQFHPIVIEIKLNYRAESIATMNQFEYSFQAGKLNEFPSSFSLSDFVPDMTFGEYVNELKNWLNLDIDIQDTNVEINYTQNAILKKQREDHRHLEIPKPKKTHNSNRFYKLTYANGEQVMYNKNGQVFSELDEKGADVIEIKMDVQPAVVEQNDDIITAVVPDKRSKIDFCLFKSPGLLVNDCAPETANELSQQNNFNRNWSEWLQYRVHSKTFKESFECSVHERININELSFKYNELHVIKKLKKKYQSEKTMKVDLESETF
ncbi:hypothetical protein JM79_2776 [Gramella sp. Hel_I_59]|uniref:hypothetical protein n=1 Tax=Gramella sp. Hel_I_59 TaxID=1249978 RepID=UPI0011520D02|nr:hypothetical protein [Gramella sp. Hel_I_59]TQI71827.1 hypothetical protein JM79_2776 [Gramella sp. Hel_I_59]